MNVFIQKLNGLWHLIVGSCQIRTPFLETQDRALVVAYARRVYPGARIFERDWRVALRKERSRTVALVDLPALWAWAQFINQRGDVGRVPMRYRQPRSNERPHAHYTPS